MPGVILVIGATGNVGRHIVGRLGEISGAPIRAFVREGGRPKPEGIEIVHGDLVEHDDLRHALLGVESVMLMWPLLTTDGGEAVVEAIAASAARLVYLSSVGVGSAEESADPIFSMHAHMERLIHRSDISSTILRSDTIASNTLGWAHQIRTTGVVRAPLTASTAVVDPRDLANVASVALTDARHIDRVYHLTGPQTISRPEQVNAIGAAIGRRLRFEEIAVEDARSQMMADGRPPELINALLAAAELRSPSTLVSPDIQELTHQSARSFEQWALEHADAFR